MIYFLVNNNYQYIEAKRHAVELLNEGYDCGLIAIPHTLTLPPDGDVFKFVTVLNAPIHQTWLKAWLQYITISNKIQSNIKPKQKDTLIFFTEFELLNQLVAIYFKKNKARVYLIEDGGVGSYIPLTIGQHQPYSPKERVRKLMVMLIPNMLKTQFTKFDGIVFPMLCDQFLDGVLLYRRLQINRKIPIILLKRPPQNTICVIKGRVVFLNQPFYCEHIQSPAVYADGLRQILASLCNGFSEIYFKFHPRETSISRHKIVKEIINDFPDVRIIDAEIPFESMLSTICPEVVASYNSTPLFNLVGTGIQPMFVYGLLNDLHHQHSFMVMHDLLAGWQYQFPRCWEDLSSGFYAGDDFNRTNDGIAISGLFAENSRDM